MGTSRRPMNREPRARLLAKLMFRHLPGMEGGVFDLRRNFLRMGNEDDVAGASDLDRVTLGARGVPTLQIRIDGSIASRYHHPAGLTSPGGGRNGRGEVVVEVPDLGARHEGRFVGRKVGRE